MHIASEHIQQWIRTGKAVHISPDAVIGFADFLNTLPWSKSGNRLDWMLIGGIEANLAALSDAQLIEWFRSTPLGRHPYLVFWFAPNEDCIACESEFAIVNIDHAFWKAPGTRYLFGASFDNEVLRPTFSNFAEYDGSDSLVAARQA